jgi:hypothetical protein
MRLCTYTDKHGYKTFGSGDQLNTLVGMVCAGGFDALVYPLLTGYWPKCVNNLAQTKGILQR